MPDAGAGTQLTVLWPTDHPTESVGDRLADFYAYPDDQPTSWVRGNMITSLDGGAAEDGKSGGLGGPGDRAVFVQMREAADVILVGATTVRVENYSGAQLSVAARQARQRRGQAEVPPIAIITRSGELDPTALVFTRTEVPPLVLTCTNSLDDTRHRLGAVAEIIDASASDPDTVDPGRALTVLALRNLTRILTEGGPSLLGLLIQHDLLDELCLTAAPILVGGDARRIVTGPGAVHTKMRRTHVLTDDDGYLYTRYVRAR
jgi:riboflavin biosynthesis pyrimidine reductase